MIRPIDELMAYYAFIFENGPRKRRPVLSEDAQAQRIIFERLMRKKNFTESITKYFHDQWNSEEVHALIERYLSIQVEKTMLLDNRLVAPIDVDFAFESQVAHFTRMQERDRLRKRFRELEEEEVMTSFELAEKEQINPHYSNKPNASEPSVFMQIVIGMVFFFLLIYLIRWLLHV